MTWRPLAAASPPPSGRWVPRARAVVNAGSFFATCTHDPKTGGCLPRGAGGRAGAPAGRLDYHSTVRALVGEPQTPPPPGVTYNPNVKSDGNHDRVTDAARVGVPAWKVPDHVPQLPNLTAHERRAETAFREFYHKDPDGAARRYRTEVVPRVTKSGEPPTFGTDDAKLLSDHWNHPDPAVRSVNRATLNNSLHQTANAIVKRAFLQHLDTLRPGDEVLVTVGGCGSGKGYALKNVPEALEVKKRAKAVWDSAGDQNATENPWIQRELEKRGLRGHYVYVHADPKNSWANPKMGVVKRAGDPADGRMVDHQVFADSYAIGARNHQAFYEDNRANPAAGFTFLDNRGTPKRVGGIPPEALRVNGPQLADFAARTLIEVDFALPHVKRGGLVGARIWR